MSYNLWTDCSRVPITELLSFIVDNRGKTVPTASCGHKLIATNCVTNNTLFPVYEKIRYISDETYNTWFRSHPLPGDILFVNKGTPGRVCMVPDSVDFCIAQDMIALRADSKKIYNKYLFAVLRSREIQQQIYNTNVGDVIPHFKKQFLDQLLIPVPEWSIQKEIGDLYYTISLEAEYNKKINDNLQQQARAIYKEWFIDFGSTSGTTPSTWKHGKLKDVLQLHKRAIKSGANTTLPYLPIDTIPMQSFGVTEFRPNDEAKSSLITFQKDDIIVGAMRVYFHRVVLAPCDGITRTTCFTLSPYNSKYLSYALLTCDLDSSIDHAQNTSKGSTMPYAVWDGGMGEIEIIIPPIDVAEEFNNSVLPMLRQIQRNCEEIQILGSLRDTLLPKLMSGEIDVSDVKL